jgi:murein DD-endopeptidase MepM/ murein hydrolase activator NlpD
MTASEKLAAYLKSHPTTLGNVVDFDERQDKLYHFDFTAANAAINPMLVSNTAAFAKWVDNQLKASHCRYGIGGYMEHRTLYASSALFDAHDEPRRLHLGIDIWGLAGTRIYSPLPATIHSFNDNNNFGDYGGTIILTHQLPGLTLYSLYGHLSRKSLDGLELGQSITINEQIATLGDIPENGHWPPHLHFQLMFDMQGCKGDYPGVGQYSKKARYLENIPDPNLLLQFPEGVV